MILDLPMGLPACECSLKRFLGEKPWKEVLGVWQELCSLPAAFLPKAFLWTKRLLCVTQ